MCFRRDYVKAFSKEYSFSNSYGSFVLLCPGGCGGHGTA